MKIVYTDNYYPNSFPELFTKDCWLITDNLEQFQQTQADYKIAMIHLPDQGEKLDSLLEQLLPQCIKIFVFGYELHTRHVESVAKHRDEKITWVVPGFVYGIENTLFHNLWLKGQVEMYRQPQITPDLELLRPYDAKQYYFDMLTGSNKPHKDFITEKVFADALKDKIFTRAKFETFIFPQDVTEGHAASHAVYRGWGCLMANIIPLDIYNKTAYSIILETQWENTHFFLTEKIAKCLLARRLFVVFSGQHWLRSFKTLGFKTFDSVVDESYDAIEDNYARWTAGYEQIKYLCTQDQSEVLAKIQPILDYNFNHMWNTDWRGILDQQVLSKIDFS